MRFRDAARASPAVRMFCGGEAGARLF